MPPIRTPLRNIDGNRRGRGPKLTPYERGKIIAFNTVGYTPRQIELEMKVSRLAVRGTIALDILRTNGNSLPRKDRALVYNKRDRRAILRNLRQYPKLTFQ
jgi:hypothetical protein